MLEPAVSSLQPTADRPQTGPAECAERLNKQDEDEMDEENEDEEH